MYFKVLPNTSLFIQLLELRGKMELAGAAAMELAKSLGFKAYRAEHLFGGISSLCDPLPETNLSGYKKSGYDGEYMPKKANTGVRSLIDSLPSVKYKDINNLIDFWPHSERLNRGKISFCPGFKLGQNVHIINVSENYINYKPVAGMIEITASEFNQLSKLD